MNSLERDTAPRPTARCQAVRQRRSARALGVLRSWLSAREAWVRVPPAQDSFLDEGFILDKRIGVGQPKRIENAKILVANTGGRVPRLYQLLRRFQAAGGGSQEAGGHLSWRLQIRLGWPALLVLAC